MAFENFPTIEQPNTETAPAKKSYVREILTGILLVALLGTWAYVIWDKNKTQETIKETNAQLAVTANERNDLIKRVEELTLRYDMIKSSIAELPQRTTDSNIIRKNREIEEKKAMINQLLSKVNATKEELEKARQLINSLNEDIVKYKVQIETLQGEKIELLKENQALTDEKIAITLQKEKFKKGYDSANSVIKEKEKIIDVGSTLHASNFNIVGINETKSGKEKETSTAKRVDKLRISFEIDENRIAKSGRKDLMITITGPDGLPVIDNQLGSGKFITRDGQEKLFTTKIQINYTQSQIQTVSFDWRQETSFSTGEYKIEVYHNGYKIGEGYRKLKKGGIFG